MSGAPGTRGIPDQLPLGVTLRDQRSFANFVPGPNGGAVASLERLLAGSAGGAVLLWGARGSGKSHLLEACCGFPALHGEPVAYLPLGDARIAPEMLEGLADVRLLCVDDADRAAGDARFEEALFHLYNRAEQARCPMVLAAGSAPRSPPWRLPDLVSRLNAAVVWHLRELDDAGRRQALALHARERGFALGEDVTAYLMKHLRRDMVSLVDFLDRLDRSSLAAQRRVTLPFVRGLLEPGGQRTG